MVKRKGLVLSLNILIIDMIEIVNGSILDTGCKVIAHQVNCIGVMGSGVAKCIKERWPDIFLGYLEKLRSLNHECLGGCLLLEAEPDKKYVANLFAQYFYNGYFKDSKEYFNQPCYKWPGFDNQGNIRFTNYEAFYNGLNLLKIMMTEHKLDSVSFPYKIGSDRGGGDWEIIRTMISSVFSDTDIYVEIRKKEE